MAQGTVKKSRPLIASTRRPTSSAPKKGHRTIRPKKALLVQRNRVSKRFTAGLTQRTEKALAEKVGHLEVLGGGKRDKKKQQKKEGEGERKKNGK